MTGPGPRPAPLARLIGAPTTALALAGGLLLLALALLVTVSVVRRWLTSSPVQGDFELVQTGLALVVFAFLPRCQWRHGNIVVDTFTTWLPGRVQGALDAFWAAAYAVVAAVLAWRLAAGGIDMLATGQTSMVLALPIAWAILLCALLAGWLAVTALGTVPALMRGDRA